METDLNADPTDEFVTKGERKGSGHEWTCNCCGGKFIGHKRKITVRIAGKNVFNDRQMGVRTCTPASLIQMGDQYVPNTEKIAFLKRARPLLLNIKRHDEITAQKQVLKNATRVIRRTHRNHGQSTPCSV